MSKYQINYNRVAPDHRVPFDYNFLKKNHSPLDYFKVFYILFQYWRQGFNTSWLKYYHIHLTGVYTALLGVAIVYCMWDSKSDEIVRDKVNKLPALQ